jgi:integrase
MKRKNFMNFTDSNISELEIGTKKYDVRDRGGRQSLPGLLVRVESSGTKTFYFVYSFNRRREWLWIGPAAMGVAAARLRIKEEWSNVSRGINPQAARMANRGGITFEQLQKRHVEEYAKIHNKSWEQADKLIRAYVLPSWGNLRASEIKRAHVRALFGKLSVETPILANQVKAAVSAVFKFGMDEEVVTLNPCKGIKDNPTNDRERKLSKTELPLFWKACDSVHPVKAAVLKTILLTGQRPGEVSHMRREHIRDGWWELPGKPVPGLKWPGTKNKESHWVWLSSKVQELIGEGTTGFVFASERGNAVGELGLAMREISKLCAFDPVVTPHDLRRTMSSTITARKHGRDAMNRILNHRKKGDTETYDRHDYEDENKIIMEDVAATFTRSIDGEERDNVVAAEFRKAK